MKKKVLVTEPIPQKVIDYLESEVELERWDKSEKMPRELLLQKIPSFHGLITSKDKIDQEFLQTAKNIEGVSNISVGYDNLDIEALKASKVIATHTPYVLDETVADLIFGLILATARRIPELQQYVREGNWNRSVDQSLFGYNVHHKKLGIIGMGRIGEKVARRAKLGFEMEVSYYNRSRKEDVEKELDVKYEEMNSLLQTSDFILLMTPLTKQTHHMINAEAFKMMKPTCFFINAARGAVVDEEAMINALENKEILGAGLDVFEQEPVAKDNPLLEMDNVVTLPHVGSATAETREEMKLFAAKNMLQLLKGEKPDALIKELQ
ncbi:D-glycerate dehydrogenase [Gracilibacillus oryzae]|uniref:D-glycerate dehydrogenase n=1 Tax=Gracilibacillus oryzae TaxID=1672701 RepID=A0A7C8KPD4_9BACI|nr:D-glycerate dehydrogenase [Gracilibacillus oryzae]KAB8131318.1 D-glycerate dehydrogenase [Gracilibacillus oryzae]